MMDLKFWLSILQLNRLLWWKILSFQINMTFKKLSEVFTELIFAYMNELHDEDQDKQIKMIWIYLILSDFI